MQEFERLRRGGLGFVVFAWPALWWLRQHEASRRSLLAAATLLESRDGYAVFELERDREHWRALSLHAERIHRRRPGSQPSAEAIAQLESLRERGAELLLFPRWTAWWLDDYEDLRRHLDATPTRLCDENCLVYDLRRQRDTWSGPADHHTYTSGLVHLSPHPWKTPPASGRRGCSMRRGLSTAFTLLSTILLAASVAAQPTKLGKELQVNSYTVGPQALPAIATDAEGDFVVVWDSKGQDGTLVFEVERGVFGQRFSSAGAPLAAEFRVNLVTMYDQGQADVAMAANGNFFVVWDDSSQDGFTTGIFVRRFSSAGVAAGAEFLVNETTSYQQYNAAISAKATGDFVVVWTSADQSDMGIWGRLFSSAGAPITGEFRVNSYTEGRQYTPAVAMDSDGDFVVTWRSAQGGDYNKLLARRYSSAGGPQGDEFLVSPFTARQDLSAVTFAGSDFVVVWDTFLSNPPTTGSDIFIRRFSSNGTPLAPQFQVNTQTFNSQSTPDVAAEADGGVVVVWESAFQDGSGFALMGRRFSSAGLPVGGEFQVNRTTADSQHRGSIATDAAGRFVVVWQSGQTSLPQYMFGQDGSYAGIFLQRFATGGLAPATLDIDGDGDVTALTDGRLVIRHLFGFSGATLLEGVDLAGCTRCEAGPIESHLASIADDLDIDGDTESTALTDGILVFRYLFEFTGASLISGAVDEQNCTRCEAEDIETQLDGLTAPGG